MLYIILWNEKWLGIKLGNWKIIFKKGLSIVMEMKRNGYK